MEYGKALSKYGDTPTPQQVAETLARIKERADANMTSAVYRLCLSCTDLTPDGSGSRSSIEEFTLRVFDIGKHYPDAKNVASICVYPNFVETAGLVLGSSDIPLASLCGGFPSSQTFIEVKMLETAMVIEQGADEVEMVINLGEILDGGHEVAASEIEMLRREAGEDVVFKVNLEAGALNSPELVYKAALIAMTAGADFLCTSTGSGKAATPESAIAICEAIKAYYANSQRRVGFKASGTISSIEDAVLYYTIAEEILGPEWLCPAGFRIGGYAIANELLRAVSGGDELYF